MGGIGEIGGEFVGHPREKGAGGREQRRAGRQETQGGEPIARHAHAYSAERGGKDGFVGGIALANRGTRIPDLFSRQMPFSIYISHSSHPVGYTHSNQGDHHE